MDSNHCKIISYKWCNRKGDTRIEGEKSEGIWDKESWSGGEEIGIERC
jgi:hypothetical protein